MQPTELEPSCDESALLPVARAPSKRAAWALAVSGVLMVTALCAAGGMRSSTGQHRSESLLVISRSGKDDEMKSAEAYKKMIQTIIDKFAHICPECRRDAEKYYSSKLDEVSSLEKKCEADVSACKDVKNDMQVLRKEVDGAWKGTGCPQEMPLICRMSSGDCSHFPKRACAPKTCHPINLLKSMATNNNCKDATIECDGQEKISLKEKKAEAYKQMILTRIAAFAHICAECRGAAKKYYGSKLDEVSLLEKRCETDEAACKDVQKDMDVLIKEVDGAWNGTLCPKEMPMSCKMSSDCKHFPTRACAPNTCHAINLLKSIAKNNNCKHATIECNGQEKVSLEDA